ncbi:MAG: sigma-70 family RNA polymerase sigma factor [Solirubrobacterales bacterium]|nr:sigma-70 family RNA polymerase sigma factor [Solirubrobacterales bacterium]
MEAASIRTGQETAGRQGIALGSPLLRLQSDERLVTMIRRGNQNAFEALVSRYQGRLLGFCRNMLRSNEDAEDVLQEVFASAYTAMLADEREITVRPWLYKIARNRSLNHMRRSRPIGVDSMDIHVADYGTSTADRVEQQSEFRELVADIGLLPETQRTALLLREVDGLPYEQIADAMETTVPSVKSLLVRARVALAELSEARGLTCDDVRLELGEIAEGLKRRVSPPIRRHMKSCDSCKEFKAQLTVGNKVLAGMAPIGALAAIKQLVATHVGLGGSSAATAGGSTVGAGAASGLTSTLTATVSAVATKAAAGVAAAALVTAGAVEVQRDITSVAPQSSEVTASAAPTNAAAPLAAITPAIAPAATTVPVAAAATTAPAVAVTDSTNVAPADMAPVANVSPADTATAPATSDVVTTEDTTVLDPTTDGTASSSGSETVTESGSDQPAAATSDTAPIEPATDASAAQAPAAPAAG